MIHTLHGNFGLPADWNAALRGESGACAWNLWEIRQQFPEARTLEGFARWFNQAVAKLPCQEPRTLAGYSLGGRLALHVLIDQPKMWSRALFISTHPGLENPREKASRLAHDLEWHHRCLSDNWASLLKDWDHQPVLQSTSPDRHPDLTKPWRDEIASAFTDWSLGNQGHLLPALAKIETPTIWAAGATDAKFAGLSQAAASQLPGSSLVIIPHAGHRLLQEDPETIGNLLHGQHPLSRRVCKQ